MQQISIGDAELSVGVSGEGSPLFLVSGLGGRASFWTNQVKPFAVDFQVITHDHRGTGGSTKSAIAYSVAQMADDVLRLMDALSVPKAAIVGHSTGGAIAQYLAIEHADRLTSIVLSATWAGPNPYFQTLFQLRKRMLKDLGPESYLMDGILRAYPPQTLSKNTALLTDSSEDRLAAFPGIEIETSRIEAVLAHDLREQIPRITVPAMVIGAADDQITPVTFSEELAELISEAHKVILPYGGHFMPQVSVDVYNHAVLSFLKSSL